MLKLMPSPIGVLMKYNHKNINFGLIYTLASRIYLKFVDFDIGTVYAPHEVSSLPFPLFTILLIYLTITNSKYALFNPFNSIYLSKFLIMPNKMN